MDTPKNKLSPEATAFFKGLSNYIDTKILFFGSIQRADYFSGLSDIDVDIFTDNEYSTMKKMQNYLHISKKEFKKVMWHLDPNNRLVTGYKMMYKNPEKGIIVEFSIYNEKYKEDVLKEHNKKSVLPFYVSWLLIILKFLFYKLQLLSKESFNYMKKLLLTLVIGYPEEAYIVLDKK